MEDIIFIKPASVKSKFLDKKKYSGALFLWICTPVFFLWYLLERTLSWSDYLSDTGWTTWVLNFSLYTLTIVRKILKSQGLNSNFWSRQVIFLETRLVLLLSPKITSVDQHYSDRSWDRMYLIECTHDFSPSSVADYRVLQHYKSIYLSAGSRTPMLPSNKPSQSWSWVFMTASI